MISDSKSQCAPAGNGRCYFVPEKTVSLVEEASEKTGQKRGKGNQPKQPPPAAPHEKPKRKTHHTGKVNLQVQGRIL